MNNFYRLKTFTLFTILIFSINLNAQLPWSDPATWPSGTVPVADEDVVIPMGTHILLDEDTEDLAGLTIHGILEFDNQNLNLTADYIMVMGELHVGSASTPFTNQAIITLNATDTNENIMGMGTRGIMVMGGLLELHGNPPSIPWSKINAHAPAGATTLTMMETVNWNVNDQVVVGITDFFDDNDIMVSQRVNLTAVSGTQLTVNAGMNAFRWGLMQYATTTGMSTSNANLVTPPAASGFTPTELDERAPVGNLTRNIVIQAPDDALWNNDGFGAHVMIMRNGYGATDPGVAHVNGVEFRRAGQRGNLGRYPFHWHMLSYQGPNTYPDATGQYLRNSTVNESMNRGIVIHGTNGVEVSNNVVFNVRGHGIFTEDASERRNIIDGNLVLRVTDPDWGYELKNHESRVFGNTGSSAFWISNPDNTIINNMAGDCERHAFWLAFTEHPWGLSDSIDINPDRLQFGVFDNNTAFSSRSEGIMLDHVEINTAGDIGSHQYLSTSDGQDPVWPYPYLLRFALERYKSWKNGHHAIWDRAVWADNYECVAADNCGRFFAGSGADGVIERTLAVGTSLNHNQNGITRPSYAYEPDPAAFATYHSAFDIFDNIIIDFPPVSSTMSGAFATNDYYIRPVEKGQIRNTNNLVVNSHPGVKLEAPFPHFALAGALWDPHGSWGTTSGDWLVYDDPFFTYGQTPATVAPGTATTGGVLVEGPFIGFNDFVINQANIRWEDYMEIYVERLDDNFATVGTWNVEEAQAGWLLAHMRHFAAHVDDYYQLEFPTIAEVNDVGLTVSNMHTTDDTLVVAIEYSGNWAIEQVFTSTYYNYFSSGHTTAPSYANKHVYTPVASRQAVLDSSGETYWHDTANDLVWIKLQGGIQQTWDPANYEPHDDELLYWEFYLRIWGNANPLPVELLDFAVQITKSEQVDISWKTETESNNAYFTVQRSRDGHQWENLEIVAGAGNSTKPISYVTNDPEPLVGTSYYRLQMTDHTGKFSYSETEAIHLEKENLLEVFPNPMNNVLNLNFYEFIENVEVRVVDAGGKTFFSESFENLSGVEIDLSHLPKGLYFLQTITAGRKSNLKIMKE